MLELSPNGPSSPTEVGQLTGLISSAKAGRVLCFIKWRMPLLTQLEDFRRPGNSLLIGVFSTALRDEAAHSCTNRRVCESHFDAILWFDYDELVYDRERIARQNWAVEAPAVREWLGLIVGAMQGETHRLRILATEEYATFNFLAQLRERYGIPGPTRCDMDRLCDKSLEKAAISAENIPTAEWYLLNEAALSELERDSEGQARAIESHFHGRYPLHGKPVRGCSSGGATKIGSHAALLKWLSSIAFIHPRGAYLVEEFVVGREFWATVCLLGDGTWRPLLFRHHAHNLAESLHSGMAVQCFAGSFERFKDEFPGMMDFVGRVIEALRPPHPHVFCVQGFQLAPNTAQYLFTECAYRPNGRHGSPTSYLATGISLETALLSCHLDESYEPSVDPAWNPRTCTGDIWWPSRRGTLQSRNEPKKSNLPPWFSSDIEFHWLAEVGARLEQATCLGDFVASASVTNTTGNYAALKRDMDWLATNWQPEIDYERQD